MYCTECMHKGELIGAKFPINPEPIFHHRRSLKRQRLLLCGPVRGPWDSGSAFDASSMVDRIIFHTPHSNLWQFTVFPERASIGRSRRCYYLWSEWDD
ncbi:hypothetical protein VTN77DRAFT_6991 [Rasamsonia byssochlamydoides]|uniref:uncharacterized protein n=1 Tax=Rasamsonia byssochlamydoides TaxID=89139 RepID=UPI003742752C